MTEVVARVISQKGTCEAGHKAGDEFVIGEKTPPGISLGFKDAFTASMLVQVQADNMAGVTYDQSPRAATLKFIYDRPNMNWKIFYGFNGDEPTTELPASIEGINHNAPTSESLAAMLLLSNCSADIDHFEVIPK